VDVVMQGHRKAEISLGTSARSSISPWSTGRAALFLVGLSSPPGERQSGRSTQRALGAKERHVVELFLFEVLVLGAIGSIVGIVTGTALTLIMAQSFSILKNLPVDLTTFTRTVIAFAGLLFGTGICVLGALSPVQRLKKLEPLLVIKQE
jgi:putative ABC transport system permease protein